MSQVAPVAAQNPTDAQQHAQRRGRALATHEPEKHRVEMPHKGSQTDHRHGAVFQAIRLAVPLDQHHRQPALGRVEQQRDDGRRLVAGSQHIGGAGVFATKSARVIQAHDAADSHRKRQGTDEVAGNGRQHGGKSLH